MKTTLKRASGPQGRTWLRPVAVIAGPVAAVIVWTLIVHVGGIDLRSPAYPGSGSPSSVGLATVVVVSGWGSLLAWGALAILQARVRRVRLAWLIVAGLAFLVSLGGPLSGTGISGGNRAYLVVLHTTVAVVVTSMLYVSIETGAFTRTEPASAGAVK